MPRRRFIVDDDVHEQLAQAVRASRQSITGLARALHCDRSTLYKWLHGTNTIPAAALEQLCALIHMPEDQRRAQFERRGYPLHAPEDQSAGFSPALHQLRAPTPDFVGRAHEVAQIVATLAKAAGGTATAICGIHGMGGVGKTELAYVVAQQLAPCFPDAQLVVALRGMGDAPMSSIQALQHVIRSFEPQAQLSEDIHELQARYCSYLHGKRVLVLADDAADAAPLRALLPPPGSALLVTSRQRFTLNGMRSVDLDMLPEDVAVALLLSICPRIGAAAPEMAALCCYLPLALRVGAGLLASDDSYSIDYYLAQLRQARLPHLRAAEDADDPKTSIEASLALSYRALPAAAQHALACLGVFPDGFDHRAAQAVLQVAHSDALARLGMLRRHHVIQWDAEQGRYLFHDLVREFALHHLADDSAARQRHAAYFLQLAEQGAESDRARYLQWLATMEREHANLRAAFAWLAQRGEHEALLRLAVALGPFWRDRNHLTEGQAALRTALAHARPGTQHLQASALMYAGALARLQGTYAEAQRNYEASRALWRWLEDEEQFAQATFQLGLVVADQGEQRQACMLFEESLALFQRADSHERMGMLHASLGRMALDAGNYVAARQHFDASYTLLHDSDDVKEFAWLLTNMARYAGTRNDFAAALDYVDQALARFEQLGHSQGSAWALLRRGMVLKELRRYVDANAVLVHCLALHERLANRGGQALAHQMLAEIALTQHDNRAVQQHATDGFHSYQKLNNRPGMSMCLILLAGMHTDATAAAMVLGAAEALLHGTGVNLETAEFHAYMAVVTRVRLSLREGEWAMISRQGHGLSLDEALALALNVEGNAAAIE